MAESVKECIDTIYELTKDECYVGTFVSFQNKRIARVATELVHRGVLEKTKLDGNFRFSYKWVAKSAPTKNFYISVAMALGQKQQDYSKKSYDKKHADNRLESLSKNIKPTETASPIIVIPAEKNDLSSVSIEELWAELKSRGVIIENNHLVIIERRVIA